jgi:hypothetical protein
MKTRIQSFKTNQASTLLAVALLAVIVGGALGCYLLIVQQETSMGFRSQTWNTALMVAEAGVEDALALVNKYENSPTGITNWYTPSSIDQDHWTKVSSSSTLQVYSMTRQVGSIGSYTVYVTNTYTATTNGPMWVPTVFSTGTVTNNFGPAAVRKVLVQTVPDSNKIGGLIATTTMTLSGNNTVDSYDSSNPSYSLWHSNWWFQGRNFGTYTNTLRSDQAVVATDLQVISILGGDLIYGYVDTGPGGAASLKGNGNSVGDLAWVNGGNSGIQSGHARDDMNVVFADAIGPIPTNSLYNAGTGWANGRWLDPYYNSSGTNIGGNTYYYMLTNVNGLTTSPTNQVFYALDVNTFPGYDKNKTSIFIGASNCVFLMTNGLSLKNGDNLTLDVTRNANVAFYTGGTFDVGNGSVNNVYQYAPTFKIYGLPTCLSIIFPANATCVAWIYAPEADVTFNGGGSSPFDIAGAFMVRSVALKGHFNFHFDQVLRTNEPPYRYVADNWSEVH